MRARLAVEEMDLTQLGNRLLALHDEITWPVTCANDYHQRMRALEQLKEIAYELKNRQGTQAHLF